MKNENVDCHAYSMMLSRMEDLENKIIKLSKISENGSLSNWMDAQDVCKFLSIKPRTLQNLRTNGTLAYTRIGRKIFYRREDARSLIKLVSK